jgi:drug/metabolite transporter (DMT)-like permease
MQKKRVSDGLFDRDGHCISFTLLEMKAVNKNPTMLLTFAPGIFVLMWSTGYVAAKFGLGYIEPLTFLALRFACVVTIMAVLFIVLRPPLPKTRSEWAHLAIVGFLLQSMYFGMCYQSFNAGLAVGTLALILSLQPIIVALVAPRWSGETVSWSRWLGL